MTNHSYTGPAFEATDAVNAFNAVPRFGHLDDITEIFESDGGVNREKAISYVLGTIFIPATLLSAYFVFITVTIIFKLCCKNKFPVLAGESFQDEGSGKRGSTKSVIIRVFLLACSIVLILSGILFLTKGTQSIETTESHIHDGLDGVLNLIKKVDSTADSFVEVGKRSELLGKNVKNIIDQGICELNPLLPSNDTINESIDKLNIAATELADALESLNEYAVSEAETFQDLFSNDVNSMVTRVKEVTEDGFKQFRLSYYAGPSIAFGAVFSLGLILASMRINVKLYFCIQKWFVFTVFFIFITFTMVVITVVGLVLVANTDICIGNPRGSPEGLIEVLSDKYFDEALSSALNYYIIDGCTGNFSLLDDINVLLGDLGSTNTISDELVSLLNIDKQFFEFCVDGYGPLDNLEAVLNNATVVFDDLLDIGSNVTSLLACENINPLWIDIVHDASCTGIPTALAWMFSTMTAIYSVGIFIFMIRGAFLPVQEEGGKLLDQPTRTADSNDYEYEDTLESNDYFTETKQAKVW